MAIGFDAKTLSSLVLSGNSVSYTHTITGSNPFLVIGVITYNFSTGSPSVTATCDGAAMTAIANDVIPFSGANNYRLHAFYTKAPGTGSKSVVATAGSGTGRLQSVALSYIGVDQISPFLTSNTVNTTDSGSNITASLTTAQTAWWTMVGAQADTAFTTGGSNTTTLRETNAVVGAADSNGNITAQTGNGVMNFAGGTRGGGGIIFAFKEATASIPSSNFLLMGVG